MRSILETQWVEQCAKAVQPGRLRMASVSRVIQGQNAPKTIPLAQVVDHSSSFQFARTVHPHELAWDYDAVVLALPHVSMLESRNK